MMTVTTILFKLEDLGWFYLKNTFVRVDKFTQIQLNIFNSTSQIKEKDIRWKLILPYSKIHRVSIALSITPGSMSGCIIREFKFFFSDILN